MKLTGIVLTKNNQGSIRKCLTSLSFCDQILVVDDYSDDLTTMIARESGAIIYQRRLNSDFSAQRNFGLDKARSEWVLFVDSDEEVTKELADEIIREIQNSIYNGYFIQRIDVFNGKKIVHGATGNTKLIRLARKNRGIWSRGVHERWNIKTPIGNIEHYIIHYAHSSVTDFIDNVGSYFQTHAIENQKEGKKSNYFKITIYPVFKFFDSYLFRYGFLDGIEGFLYSVIMSFHSFLSWSDLWLYQKRNN